MWRKEAAVYVVHLVPSDVRRRHPVPRPEGPPARFQAPALSLAIEAARGGKERSMTCGCLLRERERRRTIEATQVERMPRDVQQGESALSPRSLSSIAHLHYEPAKQKATVLGRRNRPSSLAHSVDLLPPSFADEESRWRTNELCPRARSRTWRKEPAVYAINLFRFANTISPSCSLAPARFPLNRSHQYGYNSNRSLLFSLSQGGVERQRSPSVTTLNEVAR